MAKKASRDSEGIDPKLVKCKYCEGTLDTAHRKLSSKKRVGERLTFWGGREFIATKVFQIQCPASDCGKKYSVRIKGSDWLYK